MTFSLAAAAPLAASSGHVGHGESVLTAVLTVASVVGVAHGSTATESVAVASLGSMKETAPVCGASNHASTVAPPPPG